MYHISMRRLQLRICALTCLGLSLCAASQAFMLTVVHTNDVHSRVEAAIIKGKPFGGYARLSTVFKQIRATEKNVIALNAGDNYQGTVYFNVYKGMADAMLMEMLGYQAVAIGNHEFDDGIPGIMRLVGNTSFPLVSSNIDFSAEPILAKRITPYTVLKVGNEKVGVIGAMTPDLFQISSPGPTLNMLDIDMSIRRSIESLEKTEKVNKIILLSHCGYDLDKILAANHPKLDLIVGGHSHSYLGAPVENFPAPLGPYPTKVGNVNIVQAWEWGKVVGMIQLDFDKMGNVIKVIKAKPILVDEKVVEDPMVLRVINTLMMPVLAMKTQVIGETMVEIARGSQANPASPMGQIVADAQLAATSNRGTVICLMNSGGVRSGVDAGPITFEEAVSVQPFGNTLVILDLKGSEIKAALEVGAVKGGLIQVSKGMSYEVSKSAPEGSKIKKMMLNGTTIGMDTVYRCVVNNFMARGGDGFVSLGEAKGYRHETGDLDIDAFTKYLTSVRPMLKLDDPRIKFVD